MLLELLPQRFSETAFSGLGEQQEGDVSSCIESENLHFLSLKGGSCHTLQLDVCPVKEYSIRALGRLSVYCSAGVLVLIKAFPYLLCWAFS